MPPDTVRYTLNLEFDYEPGTHFEYAQFPCTVLNAVVEEAVGRDVQAFAQSDLVDSIGIDRREWFWRRDSAGNTRGWAHLHISPKALARVGHLMLNEGKWGSNRVLSRRYVRESHEPSETNPAYGYLLWTNAGDRMITPVDPEREEVEGPKPLLKSAPKDPYKFSGLGGQLIYIVPSLDMVVVRTGVYGKRSGATSSSESLWTPSRTRTSRIPDRTKASNRRPSISATGSIPYRCSARPASAPGGQTGVQRSAVTATWPTKGPSRAATTPPRRSAGS
jgi:CubicO group peptidase (beta-lactamase class C family)